tara:strand:+ start:1004 stop:1270 length:267 start_codon:yes stop_codon:yes gene_type:complete
MKATRKYYIRVRAEYVGYYEVEAKDISEAEHKASDLLHEDMNDPIYGDFDFEQYDPRDSLPYNESNNPDKYQSIGSDNQDYFSQEEKA